MCIVRYNKPSIVLRWRFTDLTVKVSTTRDHNIIIIKIGPPANIAAKGASKILTANCMMVTTGTITSHNNILLYTRINIYIVIERKTINYNLSI